MHQAAPFSPHPSSQTQAEAQAQSEVRRVLLPRELDEVSPISEDSQLVRLHGLSMGTSWSVQLYLEPTQFNIADRVAQLNTGIQSQLDLVVAQMSPWEENSDLMRFNRAPAGTWHRLPAEFREVLDHALFLAAQTQGAYDPSIAHLANLWGFGPAGKVADRPSADAITQARKHTDWQRIQRDASNDSYFQAGGIHLDLCSTAKGYGVDLVARYLRQQEIKSFLIEVGGELRAWGIKPDLQPWWVEIENPPGFSSPNDVVALHGLSIASSGDYLRFFEVDGKQYSHTIDPRTGWPVHHGLCSVTVLHPECMIADALATAISVLGPDEGMSYAKTLNVAARLVVREQADDGSVPFRELLTPAYWLMLDDEENE